MTRSSSGRHLEATVLGRFPLDYDELQPGDYWRVLHPKTGEPVKPDDGFWGKGDYSGNLTAGVWHYMSPDGGGLGSLVLHTVREEDDGTISIRPGDGSSNSVLHHGHIKGKPSTWHGYVEHGVWNEG